MDNVFEDATVFNQDIGRWDVSSVTVMDRMFQGASAFNQDIGDWNVANVFSMVSMFSSTPFNKDLGHGMWPK